MESAERVAEGPSSLSPETPSAEQWQQEWLNVLPELDKISRERKRPLNAVIMRASQLDAARLDSELTAMLKEQFMNVFSLFQPRVIAAVQPELTLLLDFLIFRYSVWSGRPTPGTALMNLRYRNERAVQATAGPGLSKASVQGVWRTGVEGPSLSRGQTLMYGIGMVLLRYLWTRADLLASAYQWGEQEGTLWARTLWRGMRMTETAYKLGALANFISFLRFGKYRSLLERVLSIRLVYQRASMARALSFEYLNRQLVWHELSELLLFTLPLLNVAALKRFVLKRLPPMALRLGTPQGPGRPHEDSGTSDGDNAAHQEQHQLQPCSFCGSPDVPMPYVALPCQHRYCYYCLRSQCEADPQFCCLRCGVRVAAMRLWRPASATE